VRAMETEYLMFWRERLDGQPGVTASIVPDPTTNPIDRLKLAVDPEIARISAWER